MELTLNCIDCGEPIVITVDKAGYERWLAGEGHIQVCLPDTPAAEREMLLSRICPACFESMFEGEEEEEPDAAGDTEDQDV